MVSNGRPSAKGGSQRRLRGSSTRIVQGTKEYAAAVFGAPTRASARPSSRENSLLPCRELSIAEMEKNSIVDNTMSTFKSEYEETTPTFTLGRKNETPTKS